MQQQQEIIKQSIFIYKNVFIYTVIIKDENEFKVQI